MLSGGKVPAILNNGGHRVALILLPAKLDANWMQRCIHLFGSDTRRHLCLLPILPGIAVISSDVSARADIIEYLTSELTAWVMTEPAGC